MSGSRRGARAVAFATLTFVALLATSCGGGDRSTIRSAAVGDAGTTMLVTSTSSTMVTTTSPSTSTTTTTTPTNAVPSARPHPVAAPETVAFVDASRSTSRDGVVVATTRTLPTTVWRPSAPGRFPLVVFAHGYDVGPDTYARFCEHLAAQGYVVAAPSFPLADPSRGDGLSRDDIPNEATDTAFVAAAMRSGPFASAIGLGPHAVVGHSDGADVALLAGYGAGRTDADVGAIVAMSPDAMSGPIVASIVPLLLTHGTADSVVPYSESQMVDVQVRTPHWFLTLEGADHLPPVADETQWTPSVDAAVTMFLDATVGADRAGTTTLLANLDALALSHATAKG